MKEGIQVIDWNKDGKIDSRDHITSMILMNQENEKRTNASDRSKKSGGYGCFTLICIIIVIMLIVGSCMH